MSAAALLTSLPLLLVVRPRLLGFAAHRLGRVLLRALIVFQLVCAAQAIGHGVLGQLLLSAATVGLALRLLVLHAWQHGGPDDDEHGGGGGRGGGGGPRPTVPPAGPWSGRTRARPRRSAHRRGRSRRRTGVSRP